MIAEAVTPGDRFWDSFNKNKKERINECHYNH